MLFIDARKIYTQIDRAHREFIPPQIDYLSLIARMYREEILDNEFLKNTGNYIEETSNAIKYLKSKERLSKEEKDELSYLMQNIITSEDLIGQWKKNFPDNKYRDVPGLCNIATLEEIKEQNYSLNPGRYVGVTEKAADDFDFYEKLEEMNEELEVLNTEARELEEKISENVSNLLM